VLRWLADRVRHAFDRWVEGLILAGGIALALLVWRLLRPHLSDRVAVPTWLVAAAVGIAAAVIITQGLRLHARRRDRTVTAAYGEHAIEILVACQRVVGGEIPGVTVKEWIEDGILEPARDLIRTRQTGDVRLSILVPARGVFTMGFGAGHTLASKTNFRLPIEQSFSKWAYRNGLIIWSNDLGADDRFRPHPRAALERGYRSIISVPIRQGDEIVAVFNTICAPPNAFDDADLLYVRQIGAVVELVWQLTGGANASVRASE
jgi:GAF domain-containing protein